MSVCFLDFESFYSKDYSLSKLTTEQYVRGAQFETIGFSFAFDRDPPEWVTGDDGYIAMRLHKLALPSHRMVAHNAPFDASILAFRYGIHPGFIYDTLAMARPLNDITKGGSLANLAKRYNLGVKGTEVVNALGKHRMDFTPAELEAYGGYCNNDVNLMRLLFYILSQHSTPQECYIIDMLVRMFTDPVVDLDRALLSMHLNDVKQRKAALLAKLDDGIGRDALMSNPQFAEVLRQYGVEPPMKVSKKTGKPAYAFAKTDAGMRDLLEHPDDRVQALVAARLGVKTTLEETRTEGFIGVTYRGPLPILLNYYGAHTGRASGADGLNLQNLPRKGKLRQSMRAPFGHSMVACDSAQIEARVTAYLAGQWDLVDDFAAGVDIYSKFASTIYGRHVDRKRELVDPNTGETTYPDFEAGFVGKTSILGLGFGMGDKRFQDTLRVGQGNVRMNLPLEECRRIVGIYRRQYLAIAKLWKLGEDAIKAMSRGQEYQLGVGVVLKCDHEGVHLPNGMIQRYPNLRYVQADGTETYKQDGYYYDSRKGPNYIYGPKLIENVVQGLARIIVFHQMAMIKRELDKYDRKFGFNQRFKVVLTVHDEVVAVCPDRAAEKVKGMMVRIMSKAPSWAPGLPIACEAHYGKNYAECK